MPNIMSNGNVAEQGIFAKVLDGIKRASDTTKRELYNGKADIVEGTENLINNKSRLYKALKTAENGRQKGTFGKTDEKFLQNVLNRQKLGGLTLDAFDENGEVKTDVMKNVVNSANKAQKIVDDYGINGSNININNIALDDTLPYASGFLTNYYKPDGKWDRKRILGTAGTYFGAAAGIRLLSGGDLTTTKDGQRNIVGVPFF